MQMTKVIKSRLGILMLGALLLSACGQDSAEPVFYDEGRLYKLPYQWDESRFVIQGYDGPFGHYGYELDFVMPVGSLVLAARSGVVMRVNDSNNGRCPIQKNCANNYISVDHLDGTYADYLHIKQDGACVMPGQTVEQGDAIALSGNVGISVLPHLHIGISTLDGQPPTFVDVNQKGTGIPKQGTHYRSVNELNVDYCLLLDE